MDKIISAKSKYFQRNFIQNNLKMAIDFSLH